RRRRRRLGRQHALSGQGGLRRGPARAHADRTDPVGRRLRPGRVVVAAAFLRRIHLLMKWLLAVLVVVAGLVLAAAGWLLYSDSGLRWAAALAEEALQGKLRLEGLRGALARDIEFASI